MKSFLQPLRPLILCLLSVLAANRALAVTYQWNVATPGANPWNVSANWLPSTGIPSPGDTAVFNATGTSATATTINNVVSVNTTIAFLSYTNGLSGQYHVTQIPADTTLTVTNGVTVGGYSLDGFITQVALTGAGTFAVTGGNLSFGNGGTTTFTSANAFDLSGLNNFVYTVGTGTYGVGAINRSGGTHTLAAVTNSITAATLNIGTGSTSSSGTTTMKLAPARTW